MKSILVLSLFVFISLNLYSQSKDSPNFTLGIEKQFLDSKKEFVFKPNCLLKIKSKGGKRYCSKDYTYSYKSIVMNRKDTILFDDISWIQGKVHGHTDDKIFGVITIACASPIAAFGLLDFVVEGDPGGAIAGILFVGITYAGIRLAGARKFRLSHNYNIKVIEK